ncbi:MAG: glycoside hydrolase family 113 [Chthoniobacterales bacterium]
MKTRFPSRCSRVLATASCAVILLAQTLAAAGDPPAFFKGVTVSSQTWGREWAMPEMQQSLDELKSLGANSIAIHPYARIEEDGHVRFRTIDENRYITVPLDWAHERGMSVMMIPHIAYWGTKFLWRGEITFENAQGWDNFFGDYETWIVEMARIAQAHQVELFCIGLEFSLTQGFPDRWRKIIASIRGVYSGKITYGANWNEYEQVKFWDAVDYIGVLAYFPLTKTENPSFQELSTAWEKRRGEFAKFAQQNGGKQFVFVELGYNENAKAAAEPWSFKTGGEHAAEIQARCMDAALSLTGKPWLAGIFLWKWFPEISMREQENFRLQTPAMKAVIAKHWGR